MHENTGTITTRPANRLSREAALQLQQRPAAHTAQAGKIIDWEAFHYGMLDHKFLNDPNPAKADHRHTIYELWVGELISAVFNGEIQVFSKDGQLPKRLEKALEERRRDADILIGCLFDSVKLLQHMEEYFNQNKEI